MLFTALHFPRATLLSCILLSLLACHVSLTLAAPISAPSAANLTSYKAVPAKRDFPMLDIIVKPTPRESSWAIWRKRSAVRSKPKPVPRRSSRAPATQRKRGAPRPITNNVIIMPDMIEGKLKKKKIRSVFEESLAEITGQKLR